MCSEKNQEKSASTKFLHPLGEPMFKKSAKSGIVTGRLVDILSKNRSYIDLDYFLLNSTAIYRCHYLIINIFIRWFKKWALLLCRSSVRLCAIYRLV
jgi:hypothetical protein